MTGVLVFTDMTTPPWFTLDIVLKYSAIDIDPNQRMVKGRFPVTGRGVRLRLTGDGLIKSQRGLPVALANRIERHPSQAAYGAAAISVPG
jgi:hypothetical protein